MSPPTVRCPICYTQQPVPVGSGQLVCPGCEHPFIPEGVEAKPADRTPADSRRAAVPRSSEGGSRRRDDEDDRPPTRTRRKYADEDGRPANKNSGSALPLVLICGGVLSVLVLGGAAAVAVAAFSGGPVAQATFAPSASEPLVNDKPQGNWEGQKPLPGGRPAEPPQVEPWPEPPPPKPAAPPANDLDAIVGTWKVAGFEVDGRPVQLPPGQAEGWMTFTRDGVVRSTGMGKGGKRESKFTLDPAASPKAMDIRGGNPPGPDKATLGVYELDGDTLRLCFGPADGARPTALKGPGVLTSVCVLKRVKEGDGPVAPPTGKGDLVGTWRTKPTILNGSNQYRFTFGRDGTTRGVGGPAGETKGKYTIDTTTTPHTIDLTMPGLTGRFESVPGLFEFDGDDLKLCLPTPGPGAVRPKAFPSREEAAGPRVYTLERVKEEGNTPPGEKKPFVRGVRPVPFERGWADFVRASGLPAASFEGPSATVQLAGKCLDAGVYGGGGRYLALFTLPSADPGKSAVEVIDLSTGKKAYDIDMPRSVGGRTWSVAAADRTRLFVMVPDGVSKTEFTLTRYALATGKAERSAGVTLSRKPNPSQSHPTLVAGSDATDTPLVVFTDAEAIAIDPDTLAVKEGGIPPPTEPKGWQTSLGASASADGRRLWAFGGSYDGKQPLFLVATWTGDGYEWAPPGEKRVGQVVGKCQPAAGGLVFGSGKAYHPGGGECGSVSHAWPAVNGGGLVTTGTISEGRQIQFGPDQPPVGPRLFDWQLVLPETPGLVEPMGVVVTWKERGKSLGIHKYDLPKSLAAHTGDEPLLTLAPPAAERGKTFTCTPLVWSKGKDAELSLTAGPPGMTVNADGRLEWAVPKGFAESFVTVTLTASTPNGTSTSLTVYPAVVGRRN